MSYIKEEYMEKEEVLLELQKKYRKGIIKEEDLTIKEILGLKKLYKKQIKYLEKSIEEDKKKIIEMRKKYSI